MNKDEALIDFLKALRIVLNNASAYPKEHPYFIKSVESFKEKFDPIFIFLEPLKIGITPDSLFIDGRHWRKQGLYVDLAQLWHLRKIKSVEFRRGLTAEELLGFFAAVSLPVREILKAGGLQNILGSQDLPHIAVEELDYSEFLRSEGEEAKDIWAYLFKEAVQKVDAQRLSDFADNFENIISKFRTKDLLEDEELLKSVRSFLDYLKAQNSDKFNSCSRELLRSVLRDKGVFEEKNLEMIRHFFTDLGKDDLTEELIRGITQDENFNYQSLALFSRLFDEDTHIQVAPALSEKIKGAAALKADPRVRKKIKELFLSPESTEISPLYRHALISLSGEREGGAHFEFSRGQAQENYRYILLNLVLAEDDPQALALVLERLEKECLAAAGGKSLWFLKKAAEVLDEKAKTDSALIPMFEGIEKHIGDFTENAVFSEEPEAGIDYFITRLKKSASDAGAYLKKIFEEGRVNVHVLALWLKFFPQDEPLFLERLKSKRSDTDLQEKVIRSLGRIGSPEALRMLEGMFYLSMPMVKLEILRSMRNSGEPDKEFLFSVLENETFFLKKEALLVLSDDEYCRRQAMEKLLMLPNPFGKKNKLLLENIKVIEDASFRDARPYLEALSKGGFFWSRSVRKKAQELLKKWA
ncbi:MAG: hypothetical protein FJZ09_03735 [Candidatus Omnitrophica bacterium]|nr:hypothetical protein [Candidatus Omnitrophota bacterium]